MVIITQTNPLAIIDNMLGYIFAFMLFVFIFVIVYNVNKYKKDDDFDTKYRNSRRK